MVAEYRNGNRKAAKKGRRGKTPIELAATPAPAHDHNEPVFGPPVDPETLPADLLYHWEHVRAMAAADEFERWLCTRVAERRIPLDSCLKAVNLTCLFVEAVLVARIQFPRVQMFLVKDEDGDDLYLPHNESEAAAAGLSIDRPGKPKLPPPALPGCQGSDTDGSACRKLRRYGERFCPSCRRAELERIREESR